MTLALVYERMKDFPKARDTYERLLSIEPNFVSALNNLAYLYTEQLNDLNKAYDLARKARDLRANDPSIGDTLGWVLYKRGEYQQALTILHESAENAADNPEIQFHLGMTAYMIGQTDIAVSLCSRAVPAPPRKRRSHNSKR
jgi:tetratricopeptide (TPR) repeat protein